MVGAMGVGFEILVWVQLELGQVHWKYKVFQYHTDSPISTHGDKNDSPPFGSFRDMSTTIWNHYRQHSICKSPLDRAVGRVAICHQ